MKKMKVLITCENMKRALDLCVLIIKDIAIFKDNIRLKDSNDLIHVKHQVSLNFIVENIEELIAVVNTFNNPQKEYFHAIKNCMKKLSGLSNPFIVIAFHLNPKRNHKRLVNKNAMSTEFKDTIKNINYVQKSLLRVSKGDYRTLKADYLPIS